MHFIQNLQCVHALCGMAIIGVCLPVCCAVQVPDTTGKQSCKPHLVHNIIRENDILPFFHFLRLVLVTDILHTAWVARAEIWLVEIPGSLMLVLDTEGLDFKANNASEISFSVSMIQYSEPQVVVQGKLAVILHEVNDRACHWRAAAAASQPEQQLPTSTRPTGNPRS